VARWGCLWGGRVRGCWVSVVWRGIRQPSLGCRPLQAATRTVPYRSSVVIVPCSDKATYLDRYAQPDKAHTPWGGLDESASSMPFWDLDTAMASLLILQV
jgi:hypothetical protein